MAQSHFYCLDYWVLDGGTYRKSVELSFPAGVEIDCSDHAVMQTTAAFDPLIWYTTFRNSAEYAVFLAGCCPELPPSQSSVFSFCTRTFGAQMQFCNFNLPVGALFLGSLQDYLSYHFPTLAQQVEALEFGPSSTRLEVMNGITQLIQPGRPPVFWGA